MGANDWFFSRSAKEDGSIKFIKESPPINVEYKTLLILTDEQISFEIYHLEVKEKSEKDANPSNEEVNSENEEN